MKHADLSRENFQLARRGGEDETQHPGFAWRITIFFYAALHAVDHSLESRGIRPKDHDQRRQKVLVDKALASVFAALRNDYQELERLSRQARYMPEANPMLLSELREARDRSRRILEALGIQIT